MVNSKVVKAIFGTYLSIRDSENKLQEPKKEICRKFIQQAEDANTNALRIELAQALSDEMQQELSREQGYIAHYVERWIPSIFYQRNYLLHKTLHAALTYVVSELEKDKILELENAKLELNKDFVSEYHLSPSFFNDVIKLDKTNLLEETSFAEFELHAANGKRDTAIFEKVFKAKTEAAGAEIKTSVSESSAQIVEMKSSAETAVPTAPFVSVEPTVADKPAADKAAQTEKVAEDKPDAAVVMPSREATSPDKSTLTLSRILTDAEVKPSFDVDAVKAAEAKRDIRSTRSSRWDMTTPITEKAFTQDAVAKKDADEVKFPIKTATFKKPSLPPVTSAHSHAFFGAPKEPHEKIQHETKSQHHNLRQRGRNATIKLGRYAY